MKSNSILQSIIDEIDSQIGWYLMKTKGEEVDMCLDLSEMKIDDPTLNQILEYLKSYDFKDKISSIDLSDNPISKSEKEIFDELGKDLKNLEKITKDPDKSYESDNEASDSYDADNKTPKPTFEITDSKSINSSGKSLTK